MSGRRGFTLIELLVVLGLLSAFSYMAMKLLTGGIGVWRVAEEARDLDERARAVFDLLRRDLAQVDRTERARFLVDAADPRGAVPPTRSARLRFTRALGASEEARWLASGGTGAATATVGLLDVAYATAPDAAAADPAVEVLRRADAAVQGLDAASDAARLFAKDYFERRPGGFEDRAADVAGGVLHFEIALASQRTTAPLDALATAAEGGPERAWDSTRNELPKSRFSLALAGAAKPRDRVFPRRIRATLHLEREEQDRRVVRLSSAVDEAVTQLPVDDPRPLPVAADDLVKIGTEWMVVAGSDPRLLRVKTRGALGTSSTTHASGAAIHRGRAFILDVPIETHRDVEVR